MSSPRKLSVKKPVKLIFSGGFLGSGKTTALAALAKRLIERGMRVGFITNDQSENLAAIGDRYEGKKLMVVSATEGTAMDDWLEDLISGRPGANTVLSQIDYDRYATAEAVLGWLNAAVKLQADQPFDAGQLMISLATRLRDRFKADKGENR